MKSRNCLYSSRTLPVSWWGRVANFFRFFFCIVLLCVFTFWVPCCDARYDFHINTMFGSSLPPVVCARILLALIVFACV